MHKFLYGKMMLGTGKKKLQIGAGIGQKKKKSIYIQNMRRQTVMQEILLDALIIG
jgi:hypothetical protein